jgi:hypothetical protein
MRRLEAFLTGRVRLYAANRQQLGLSCNEQATASDVASDSLDRSSRGNYAQISSKYAISRSIGSCCLHAMLRKMQQQ